MTPTMSAVIRSMNRAAARFPGLPGTAPDWSEAVPVGVYPHGPAFR